MAIIVLCNITRLHMSLNIFISLYRVSNNQDVNRFKKHILKKGIWYLEVKFSNSSWFPTGPILSIKLLTVLSDSYGFLLTCDCLFVRSRLPLFPHF